MPKLAVLLVVLLFSAAQATEEDLRDIYRENFKKFDHMCRTFVQVVVNGALADAEGLQRQYLNRFKQAGISLKAPEQCTPTDLQLSMYLQVDKQTLTVKGKTTEVYLYHTLVRAFIWKQHGLRNVIVFQDTQADVASSLTEARKGAERAVGGAFDLVLEAWVASRR